MPNCFITHSENRPFNSITGFFLIVIKIKTTVIDCAAQECILWVLVHASSAARMCYFIPFRSIMQAFFFTLIIYYFRFTGFRSHEIRAKMIICWLFLGVECISPHTLTRSISFNGKFFSQKDQYTLHMAHMNHLHPI